MWFCVSFSTQSSVLCIVQLRMIIEAVLYTDQKRKNVGNTPGLLYDTDCKPICKLSEIMMIGNGLFVGLHRVCNLHC